MNWEKEFEKIDSTFKKEVAEFEEIYFGGPRETLSNMIRSNVIITLKVSEEL